MVTKKAVNETLTKVIKDSRIGVPLEGDALEFILGLLKATNRYCEKANQESIKIIPRMTAIARGRRVKMLNLEGDSLTNPGSYSKVPVSKGR